jgi:predicted flap endonuclease-1-like 5' DNA nuclease
MEFAMTNVLPDRDRDAMAFAPFSALWSMPFHRSAHAPFEELHRLHLRLFEATLKIWLLPFDVVDAPPERRSAASVADEPVATAVEPAAPPEPVAASAPILLAEAPAEPDDLERIVGIGRKLKETLNGLGIKHFRQIAAWTPEEVAAVNDKIGFRGRIEREGWQAQASRLAKGAGAPGAANP